MNADAVAIASDHAGYDLKTLLKQELTSLGCVVVDLGADGGRRARDDRARCSQSVAPIES